MLSTLAVDKSYAPNAAAAASPAAASPAASSISSSAAACTCAGMAEQCQMFSTFSCVDSRRRSLAESSLSLLLLLGDASLSLSDAELASSGARK